MLRSNVSVLRLGILASLLLHVTFSMDLHANIDMGGVKMGVRFQQANSSQPVKIMLQNNSTFTAIWAIHEYPSVYSKGVSSCSETGGLIDGGNLTTRVGRFGSNTSYMVSGFDLSGNTTLLGRSLVLYMDDGITMRACANILGYRKTILYAYVAVQGTVSGKVEFLQIAEGSNNPAIVLGELFYVNGSLSPTSGHNWYIGGSKVNNNCSIFGGIFGTAGSGACNRYSHTGCKPGDLSAKHGTVSVGIASTNRSNRRKFRVVDLNLSVNSLFGSNGKSLVIQASGQYIACGNINKMGPMITSAMFSAFYHSGISGSIKFSQASPYHSTMIMVDISGLKRGASGYHVHEFPIPSPTPSTGMCNSANVGAHLNPFGINNTSPSYPPPRTGTADRYEIGDISGKFGTLDGKDRLTVTYDDVHMPMYGRYSILGRALVIHRNDSGGSRWVCANVIPQDSVQFTSRTNFAPTSSYSGYVYLEQYMQTNDVMTETGLTVFLNPKVGSATTPNHNWHVHIDPVGNDYSSTTSRCQSVLGHYNPYKVNDKGNYNSECSPMFPLRCEVGDSSRKLAQYSIGGGKKYYVDGDTPLFGTTTVLGRSFTFHAASGGAGRIACADIIPIQGSYIADVKFTFKQDNTTAFTSQQFISEASSAVNIAPWQIRYVKRKDYASGDCNSEVSFYLLENRRSKTAANLKKEFFKVAEAKLTTFKKCNGSFANRIIPSSFLFTLMLISFFCGSWS